MSLQQPDLGVLRKAQQGDERAFSIIVRAYETPVFNYVLRLVGEPVACRGSDAGSLPARLPGPAEVLAPLQVHDLAVPGDEEPRARRAAGKRAAAAAPVALDDIAPLEVIDAPIERGETIDALWRAIEGLSDDLKMALLLRDVAGLSYTEIADSLEVTLATVKWRIYKGREDVALALAREGITFGADRAEAGEDLLTLGELHAVGEPLCERVGQPGGADRLLRSLDVVGPPAERRLPGREVEQQPGRARSPSRGWPTEPGLRSQRPAGEVDLAYLPERGRRRAAFRRPGSRADVAVPDEVTSVPESVDRVGAASRRARTPRSGRGGCRGRAPRGGRPRSAPAPRGRRAASAESTVASTLAATAASAGEIREVERPEHAEVVVPARARAGRVL